MTSSSDLRKRYQRIMRFFSRVFLNVLTWDILLARIGLRRISRSSAPRRYQQAALRFLSLATSLGGGVD